MAFVTRLLVCHFLIVTTNVQLQNAVVNILFAKMRPIFFTLTKKKGNKLVLTCFPVENQCFINYWKFNTPPRRRNLFIV